MGDGNIDTGTKNPRLEVEMISPNYLEYIADNFSNLGKNIKLRRTAKENAKHISNSGFSPDTKEIDCSDTYRWRSMYHPELQEFAEWYSSGEKVWPAGIELTPTVLKHWYCGDGCWDNYDSHNCIRIAMANEIDNTNKVDQMFRNVGLPAPSNYIISERKDGSKKCSATFTVEQSQQLWEYMGEPLPDFEYKWPQK